jgi:ATP-dependent Lhr-like helicase
MHSAPTVSLDAAPGAAHPALRGFHAPVREWFAGSFGAPTRAQSLGWPAIQSGESALVLAPTGSGKTLAAFLAAIDHLMFAPVPSIASRCRVLYVSPLKALAVDVERNLKAPLTGVARLARQRGAAFHEPQVAIRTGDTPSRERARFRRAPADILITTPESLYLLLTSAARDGLRSVRWVIVDEIHTMVGSKRGAHLALSLERLQELTEQPLQRIGLSATQRPVEEAARFLGGFAGTGALAPRPVTIVDAGHTKPLDITVEVPVEDMARVSAVRDASGETRASIWPAIHPRILELIRAHRSTLIFVNSRRLAERLAAALNDLAGDTVVHAHHGSVARERRLEIEDALKAGQLPAIVATSSLELGIDMGTVDLVIQVEAPASVTSAIQRIGRAGHAIDVPSKGVILPKYRGDLLACAALAERMRLGAVEPVRAPRNPLDVLAQQIVAMAAMDEWPVEDLARVIHRAAPFAELPTSMFEATLDMLSGRYPSDDFAELRPRVTWDRVAGTVRAREGAKSIAITNGGTIPDRGLYGVFLLGADKGEGRVGELDEEMVFESRVGETFVLGASSWRIEEITFDRVLVSPAPGVPGKLPFWHGDAGTRPIEFGRAIGALTRELRDAPAAEALELLAHRHALDGGAARNLLAYLHDQVEATGLTPDDRTIVVERFVDEMGDWRLCVLSPFGARVHGPWAMAVAARVADRLDREVDVLWTDDGIVLRFPEADEPPPTDLVLLDPDEVEDLVVRQLGAGTGGKAATALFASRFREAAARALLLPGRHPRQRAPLWQQRRRAAELYQGVARHGSFPIVLEAYRECLRDVFDMPGLVELLREIRSRALRVVTVDSRAPSPFAASLMFNYVANFIYEGDAPMAERRAQALAVDPAQLRELLGDAELRGLLDPDALRALERTLQHLTQERAARHPDGLHDMLLRLGDLTEAEITARIATPDDAPAWLAQLERARRIVTLTIAGEPRFVATEDASRYRDALGVSLPSGLPQALLDPVADPLGDLVGRYARTHGPFHAADAASRLGTGIAPVQDVLARLAASGRVVDGEFRPGGKGREWCETGVLRTLRQRSLARLRHAVEPVEQPALGRLYVAWHALDARRRGPGALLETIEQLQGAAMPASDLESAILPSRLADYRPHDLDGLTSSGIVVWIGAGPLGQHDGRVRLYLAEHMPLLFGLPESPLDDPLHQRIRRYLGERGASFFAQIVSGLGGGFVPDLLQALWDLVWAGEVTNDTMQPLRALLRRGAPAPEAPRPARALARRMRATRRGTAFGAPPPEAAGRWFLVKSLRLGESTPGERAMALAQQLLDRHGVLTREAVAVEGLTGGFSAVYGALKAMEEAGRVRRGYFVSGRGATQFALPGVVDRLRSVREPATGMQSTVMAATDPANPYGAALPWPERDEGRRPMRMAGALVVLIDGGLAAWLGRGERQLLTFPEGIDGREPAEVRAEIARVLAQHVVSGRRRALFLQEVDGVPVASSPMARALAEVGFSPSLDGYLKRP